MTFQQVIDTARGLARVTSSQMSGAEMFEELKQIIYEIAGEVGGFSRTAAVDFKAYVPKCLASTDSMGAGVRLTLSSATLGQSFPNLDHDVVSFEYEDDGVYWKDLDQLDTIETAQDDWLKFGYNANLGAWSVERLSGDPTIYTDWVLTVDVLNASSYVVDLAGMLFGGPGTHTFNYFTPRGSSYATAYLSFAELATFIEVPSDTGAGFSSVLSVQNIWNDDIPLVHASWGDIRASESVIYPQFWSYREDKIAIAPANQPMPEEPADERMTMDYRGFPDYTSAVIGDSITGPPLELQQGLAYYMASLLWLEVGELNQWSTFLKRYDDIRSRFIVNRVNKRSNMKTRYDPHLNYKVIP